MADLGEGPGGGGGTRAPTLFRVKKEEMSEGRKAGWASKLKPGPLLSSMSGSATSSQTIYRKPHRKVTKLKQSKFYLFLG